MLNVSETQKMFQEKGIKYFMMSFVDLHGTPRAKLVPAECLSDVVEGAAVSPVSRSMASGKARTTRICRVFRKPIRACFPAVETGLAWIAGNLQMDGTDWEYCPRAILSRTTERARDMGFTFMLGVEPEFFLIGKNADGTPSVADPADTLDKPCYGQLSLLRNADFLTTIISHLNELGLRRLPERSRDANGQFEINWRYADAMTTADQVSFFKFMVKALPKSVAWAPPSCPSRSPILPVTARTCISRCGTLKRVIICFSIKTIRMD
jgi:glutamine synthetase